VGKGSGKESTQFKAGQSGNPSGRPKGASLTEQLKAKANREGRLLVDVLWETAIGRRAVWVEKPDGQRVLEIQAIRPDMRAMELIWNRVEGKVPDQIVVTEGITREEFIVGLKSRIGAYESANGHRANGHGEGPDPGRSDGLPE
jgi:hypothetical protein